MADEFDLSTINPDPVLTLEDMIAKQEEEARALQEETLNHCLKRISRIQSNDMPKLLADIQESFDYYFADNSIVKSGKGRSKFTTTDLANAIEWALPSIVKIFASGTEAVLFQPQNQGDEELVTDSKDLVDYQLTRKNKWFLFCNDIIRDALLLRLCVAKYQWIKKTTIIEKDWFAIDDMTLQGQLSQKGEVVEGTLVTTQVPGPPMQVSDPMGQIVEVPGPPMNQHDVTISYSQEEEYPKVEAIPLEELGIPLDIKDVESVEFMYHQFRKTRAEMIEDFGEELVDTIDGGNDFGASNSAGNTSLTSDVDATIMSRFQELGLDYSTFTYDQKKAKYVGYECYYKHPKTNRPWLTIISGSTILYDGKNKYNKPPFEFGTSLKLAHLAIGRSLKDLIKELMRIRTALVRQIYDNAFFLNNGRFIVDEKRCSLSDFMNNNYPGGVIRGQADAVQTITPPALEPWTFQVLEMTNQERDYLSGVPRSFQGVSPDVMNSTFRGQAQQVNLAQQRIEMIARLLGEMLFVPLIQDIMYCNMRFMKDATAIRVLGKWKTITPDSITTKADIIMNVGIGTGDKDKKMMYLQQLLGIYAQLQQAGVPIITAQNAYYVVKEMVKLMDHRNTDDFVTNPQIIQTVAATMQVIQQQAMMAMQSGMQPNMALIQVASQMGSVFGLPPIQLAPPQGPGDGQPGSKPGPSPQPVFPGQQPPAQAGQPSVAAQPRNNPFPMQGGHFG